MSRTRTEVVAVVDDLEAVLHPACGFVLLDEDFTKLAERDPDINSTDAGAVVVLLRGEAGS
jgi:hypothetical protein